MKIIKLFRKCLLSDRKKVLPNLISSQQTAHVVQRCIDESARLISDLLILTQK